jgi:tRNA U55 pseudouridine synthase TruB
VDPERVAEAWDGDYGPSWLPPLAVVKDWPRLELSPEQVDVVRHGAQPRLEWFSGEGYEDVPQRVALVDGDSQLVALVELDELRGPRLAMVLGEEQSEGLPD